MFNKLNTVLKNVLRNVINGLAVFEAEVDMRGRKLCRSGSLVLVVDDRKRSKKALQSGTYLIHMKPHVVLPAVLYQELVLMLVFTDVNNDRLVARLVVKHHSAGVRVTPSAVEWDALVSTGASVGYKKLSRAKPELVATARQKKRSSVAHLSEQHTQVTALRRQLGVVYSESSMIQSRLYNHLLDQIFRPISRVGEEPNSPQVSIAGCALRSTLLSKGRDWHAVHGRLRQQYRATITMSRGRGSVVRREPDTGMLGRRAHMELAVRGRELGKRPRVARSVRFTYAPGRCIDVEKVLGGGAVRGEVDVVVAPEFLTSANDAVRMRVLWGADEYTDDSDVVAMLMHSGHFVLPSVKPVDFDHVIVRLRVERSGSRRGAPFEARDCNGLRSRAWGSVYEGARISIASVTAVKGGVHTVLAKPVLAAVSHRIPHLAPWSSDEGSKPGSSGSSVGGDSGNGPSKLSTGPSGAAVIVAAKLVPEATVSFDLSNEPCLSYALTAVANIGLDPDLWPARRLTREVLYIENASCRYEVAVLPEDLPSDIGTGMVDPPVRFAKVKAEALMRLLLCGGTMNKARGAPSASSGSERESVEVPCPASDVDVIVPKLKWSELFWDTKGVTVNSVHYNIDKLAYRPRAMARSRPPDAEPSREDTEETTKEGGEPKVVIEQDKHA